MGASGDRGAGAARRAVVYGAGPVVALAGTLALDSGERQSLSQALGGIQHQFHVGDSIAGWLPFAMGLVGIIGAPIFGILSDRFRRTALLAGAMLIWTACIGLDGLAPTFALVFVFRMGLGITEANSPAALSLLADYYPAKQRAQKVSLYQAGALAGALLGLVGGGIAVSLGGWRWAFLMWVPIGIAVAALVVRQPEPRRGDQDLDFGDDLAAASAALLLGEDAGGLVLPPPIRVGTLDYEHSSARDVTRELLHIPTFWFGMLAITVSQLLLNALQFWGVEYFKRVHHLGAAAAGGLAALLALGSVVGIIGGGFLSDRFVARGKLNARVHVVAWGSIVATIVLLPAFASTSLAVTAPLMVIGGACLTLPVAPADAMTADVVVHPLRGRAYSVRSIVRTGSQLGAVIVGATSGALAGHGLSHADSLRWAIVALTPIYALGGIVMLFAVRTYPRDVAFVVAESRRVHLQSGGDTPAADRTPGP